MRSQVIGLTPRQVVAELDRYIVGQDDAKRAVAIALRNRLRRMALPEDRRREVRQANILMIGPTGVGKTEIARRLAQITSSPFVKVEATKYTEVGYVGRDVDSMVRDLVEVAIDLVKQREARRVEEAAERQVEQDLLRALREGAAAGEGGSERLIQRLRDGELDDQWVEVAVREQVSPQINVFSEAGMDQLGMDFSQLFSGMPSRRKPTRMTVGKARDALREEAVESLLNMEEVRAEGLRVAQEQGLIFVDEIDKLALTGREERQGPGVSRQGVQRDLLPLLEGSAVRTRYGTVFTDGILFIAAGAFSAAKPSDLMPELQGRLPVRVELGALSEQDFRRILTEPRDALTVQYRELLGTEQVDLSFTEDAVTEMAHVAAELNRSLEDIGARRLVTVMEKVCEDISFDGPEFAGSSFEVDAAYVRERLQPLAGDLDLSRYIL